MEFLTGHNTTQHSATHQAVWGFAGREKVECGGVLDSKEVFATARRESWAGVSEGVSE